MQLIEVCELIVDCPHTTAKDEGHGFPLIRTPNIGKGRLQLENVHLVSESVYNARNERAVPQVDDLILAREAPVGNVAIIRANQKVCLGQRTVLIRPNKSLVDPHFLVYYLLSPFIQHILLNSANGATVSHLNMSDIRKLELKLPNISVQRKIGAILSLIEEKIIVNESINQNLLQQARTLYQSWFVDYEPFNCDRPSDWIDGTIDDLAKEIICGKTPSTKAPEYYGNDIPFITIPDMHGNTYAVTTERYLSSLGAESQRKKTLPHNSICVSCIGTAGLVTLTAQESQTNQQINSIIPKEGYSPFYIYLLMETLSVIINNLGQSGSTIVNLNKAQFGKISVIIPTVAAMKSFDGIVGPMFESILSNQKENIKLAELRDTLLPRLMTGELDVSEIDV